MIEKRTCRWDQNSWISKIEFANKGEVFLNKDLVQILRYAHEWNVSTDMGHGVNLNNASEDMLEALVRYQVARLRVSIDGITHKTCTGQPDVAHCFGHKYGKRTLVLPVVHTMAQLLRSRTLYNTPLTSTHYPQNLSDLSRGRKSNASD